MADTIYEQRNRYIGDPLRPWIRVRLHPRQGPDREVRLLADTGNPFAIIVSKGLMQHFALMGAPDIDTNFGTMSGGWLRVTIPELKLTNLTLGYAGEEAVDLARESSPELEGLIGLPFLQMMEYGGDADSFWVRRTIE